MTDWRVAGYRADAARVATLLSAPYRTNAAKDPIRKWGIAELAAVKPVLVGDLWSGGISADAMVAAGLAVLSVDDGRSFAAHGISKPRGKRSLEMTAEKDGYRAGWGSFIKYAAECDAALLDFMGHYCGETDRILRACRHMKALVITLMPERLAIGQGLPIETWIAAYKGMVELATGMKVRTVQKYRRDGGQWVLVLLAKGQDGRAQHAAKNRVRRTDPEYRARQNARQRARLADPEVRARTNAHQRARWAANPEYQARQTAQRRARRTDPEYRARQNARLRAWRAAKKAA